MTARGAHGLALAVRGGALASLELLWAAWHQGFHDGALDEQALIDDMVDGLDALATACDARGIGLEVRAPRAAAPFSASRPPACRARACRALRPGPLRMPLCALREAES
jgi:hypothetical protein